MTHHHFARSARTTVAGVFAAATLLLASACGSTSTPPAASPASAGAAAGSSAPRVAQTTTVNTPRPAGTPASAATSAAPTPASATVGATGPAGTFTSIDGKEIDVASYRGTPTLLWFIAAGCSSCTASIPAVAQHLHQLRSEGIHVAVIDLYGDLGSGTQGSAALRQLGTDLTGDQLTDPGWTWGISSHALSVRYDHLGEPDVYYLLDRTGKIIYQDGVPVSTMDQLLAAAKDAAKT